MCPGSTYKAKGRYVMPVERQDGHVSLCSYSGSRRPREPSRRNGYPGHIVGGAPAAYIRNPGLHLLLLILLLLISVMRDALIKDPIPYPLLANQAPHHQQRQRPDTRPEQAPGTSPRPSSPPESIRFPADPNIAHATQDQKPGVHHTHPAEPGGNRKEEHRIPQRHPPVHGGIRPCQHPISGISVFVLDTVG